MLGGNDQIPARLADALAGQINLGSRAHRDAAQQRRHVHAHRSAAARVGRPPTSWCSRCRSRCCARWTSRRPASSRASCTRSNELGMGTNSKLHVRFNSRHWRHAGLQRRDLLGHGLPEHLGGLPRADRQRRHPRGLHGRQRSERASARARPTSVRSSSSARSSRCCRASRAPGTVARRWTSGPATRGRRARTPTGRSASTRRSQASSAGEANCHFAGEHTSVDFQGYLNGGVETGARAAADILADLKH